MNAAMEIVNELKDSGQDFEWYPTTDEIINRVKRDIGTDSYPSVLDIGAGDGRVLKGLGVSRKYAIEKSRILVEQMDKDIFVIGTDFMQQTLIDKEIDRIFCNPPYSEYVVWTEKIIREANAEIIYLVIPDRWENKQSIKDLIKQRKATYKTLGKYDFSNAERQARAKVHLVKITLNKPYYNGEIESDPFKLWFDENFKIKADKHEPEYGEGPNRSEELKALIGKDNIINQLEKFYQADLEKLMNNYKALETIDRELLEELDVNLGAVCEALKLKISGLKNLYWKELFDNLDAITDRLTSSSRRNLLGTLTDHTNVDFTASNAYSVIIWAIKNANKYLDEQLKDIYLTLSDSQNVTLYKSNHRIIEDGWRYSKKDMTHYKLDYRIVHYFHSTFGGHEFDRSNGLQKTAHELIGDIFTVGKNLGFNIHSTTEYRQWTPGRREEFYCNDDELFCDIKCFKNGNIHFRFLPEFMKKMNIEAARLNGWIKSPKEAEEELDLTEEEAERYFRANFQIGGSSLLMLEAPKLEDEIIFDPEAPLFQ